MAQVVQREAKANRQKFLVATLRAPDDGHGTSVMAGAAGAADAVRAQGSEVAFDVLDSRVRFLDTCRLRHWQFDELRRAHWSTMMLLANLGGRPD